MLADLTSVIRYAKLMLLVFGALAIVITLTGQLQRSWVERDLREGDLRALSNIAFRGIDGPAFDQVVRLRKRGFLVKTARGPCRMTFDGLVAVLLRSERVSKFYAPMTPGGAI